MIKNFTIIILVINLLAFGNELIFKNLEIKTLTQQLDKSNHNLAFYQNESIELKDILQKNIIYDPTFQMLAFLYKYYPQMPASEKLEYIDLFVNYSVQENLPVILVADICKRESNFNPNAIGKKLPSGHHARGLFQIHPKYWMGLIEEIGYTNISDLYKPDANIYAGTKIIKHYYNDTQDIYNTLRKYVGGHHKSYINDILTSYTNNMMWLYQLSPDEIDLILAIN